MKEEQALSQIRPIKEAIEDELLQRDGVVGVDIGYKEVGGRRTSQLAIRVLVVEKREVRTDERIPATIEGIRTDVIQRGQFALTEDWPCDTMTADTARYDPLIGGSSIGTCGAGLGSGTLATFVRDILTDQIMILSCWHVLVAGSSQNLPVAQPSPNDGGICPNDVVGHVVRSQINESVDCAVAFWNNVRPMNERYVKGIGLIGPPTAAGLGDRVKKSGRTSGITYGDVDTIDLTYTLQSAGVMRVFKRQIGVWRAWGVNETFTCAGDSGSLVVKNYRYPVGMLIGGSLYNPFFPDGAYAVVTPIHAILQAMNVRIHIPKGKEHKDKDKEKDNAVEKISVESQLLNERLDPAGTSAEFHAQPQGPLEARLARLEATVDELQHFIRHADRPDLSIHTLEERPEPSSTSHDEERD